LGFDAHHLAFLILGGFPGVEKILCFHEVILKITKIDFGHPAFGGKARDLSRPCGGKKTGFDSASSGRKKLEKKTRKILSIVYHIQNRRLLARKIRLELIPPYEKIPECKKIRTSSAWSGLLNSARTFFEQDSG